MCQEETPAGRIWCGAEECGLQEGLEEGYWWDRILATRNSTQVLRMRICHITNRDFLLVSGLYQIYGFI
jgi:hypothetical protein